MTLVEWWWCRGQEDTSLALPAAPNGCHQPGPTPAPPSQQTRIQNGATLQPHEACFEAHARGRRHLQSSVSISRSFTARCPCQSLALRSVNPLFRSTLQQAALCPRLAMYYTSLLTSTAETESLEGRSPPVVSVDARRSIMDMRKPALGDLSRLRYEGTSSTSSSTVQRAQSPLKSCGGTACRSSSLASQNPNPTAASY